MDAGTLQVIRERFIGNAASAVRMSVALPVWNRTDSVASVGERIHSCDEHCDDELDGVDLPESKGKTEPKRAKLTLAHLKQNAILYGLDEIAAADVIKQGGLINLHLRQKIYEPEEPIDTVYFPLDCVLSVVTQMKDGSQIEIGTIGREGMSAFPLLMGASTTANDSYCQVRGHAVTLPVNLFRELSASHASFRQLLDRYLQAYVNMLGQLAACNRLHTVYERCSRWLLLTFDRVGADEIPLTHEYLAMMLGTGRSGVTIAASTLQQAGFVRYSHGNIRILDRVGLELAACECYEVSRQQFGGLLRHVTVGNDWSDNVAALRPLPRKIGRNDRPAENLVDGDI